MLVALPCSVGKAAAVVVLTAVLLSGCQTSPSAPAPSATATLSAAPTSGPATTAPAPSVVPDPGWVVGASPLPVGPEGFGAVLPTPQVLRNRSLPTKDLLTPPADGQFHATVGSITPSIRRRMGETYHDGCPVPLSALRYLTLTFRGFDGKAHTGELVVASSVAAAVTRVFRRLFDQAFPIEEMRLSTTADVIAPPTGDGNDTVGFACRKARGQTRLSAHAFGLAVDVNPFQNPFVRGDLVLPELASAYRDRGWVRPGMFLAGSAAVHAFTREGWTWGGTFHRPKDYQHFSRTGD